MFGVVVLGRKKSEFAIVHILKTAWRTGETDAPNGSNGAFSNGSESLPLTSREMRVLHLLADGRSTEEIAKFLFISVITARNHIRNLLRKLKVHSRVEAVSLAHRNHLA